MSENNVSLIQETYAAFGRGDVAAILDRFADSFEFYVPGTPEIPYAGYRRSREELAQFFKELDDTVVMERFEPREFIANGEKVAVVGYYDGYVKRTKKPFAADWVMVWTVRGGKVLGFSEYMDTSSLKAALA